MSGMRWAYPNPAGRIDAVVVDWGTPELARACLASLEGCDLFASIASVDAKHLGWSYARSVNTALRGGRGDVVLALNADTRMLEPPSHELELFDWDPRIAVVGPRQVSSDGLITHGGIFGTSTRPEFRCWQSPLESFDHATADVQDAVTVSGSVYFARRSVWDELGGFLETRHFYEETWFSYLARHRGHRVVYAGTSTWIHEFNRSPVSGVWRSNVAAESRAIFRAACKREGIACD